MAVAGVGRRRDTSTVVSLARNHRRFREFQGRIPTPSDIGQIAPESSTLVEKIGHTQRYSNPASWYAGPMKVTIDVDPDLYRAVKVEAARTDRSVREIVDEALGLWLDAAETEEDRASAEAALDEYRRDGGEAAEAFFGSLAAETKATYGPTEG